MYRIPSCSLVGNPHCIAWLSYQGGVGLSWRGERRCCRLLHSSGVGSCTAIYGRLMPPSVSSPFKRTIHPDRCLLHVHRAVIVSRSLGSSSISFLAPSAPPSPPPPLSVGGIALSSYVSLVVQSLIAMSRNPLEPGAHIWALHALWLTADAAGLSYTPHVQVRLPLPESFHAIVMSQGFILPWPSLVAGLTHTGQLRESCRVYAIPPSSMLRQQLRDCFRRVLG